MDTAEARLAASVYQFAVLVLGSLITVTGRALAGLLALAAQVHATMSPSALRQVRSMIDLLGGSLMGAMRKRPSTSARAADAHRNIMARAAR